MKLSPVKLLLLLSFTFWATGLAKYAHDKLLHDGTTAVVVAEDANGFRSVAAAPGPAAGPSHMAWASLWRQHSWCMVCGWGHAAQAAKDQRAAGRHSGPTNHSGCMVCQMLAAMSAQNSSPPILTVVMLPAVESVPVWDQQMAACPVPSSLGARGPPVSI